MYLLHCLAYAYQIWYLLKTVFSVPKVCHCHIYIDLWTVQGLCTMCRNSEIWSWPFCGHVRSHLPCLPTHIYLAGTHDNGLAKAVLVRVYALVQKVCFSTKITKVIFWILPLWGLWVLRGLDTLGRFAAISKKGDNFYNFLFVFLHTQVISKKGVYCKRKEFTTFG